MGTATQHHLEEPKHGERHDVPPPDATPQQFEHGDAVAIGPAGKIRCIDGSGGCADHATWANALIEQLAQHANLDRAETAAARKYEGGQS
jgi:hypothetical protein